MEKSTSALSPTFPPPSRHHSRRNLVLVACASVLTFSTVLFPSTRPATTITPATPKIAEAADEWQDNVWPYRQQTAWDISTDFSYPRTLEYDVEEGTWLRLDVHPKTGEIVFDMLGELYCLPSSSSSEIQTARPVLVGIPYDSDPHFSPEGDRIVFRSDAELGVENIWVIPWTGCEDMDLSRPEMEGVQDARREGDALMMEGIPEHPMRRPVRLLGEGRLQARRVTNETFRWVTDARFHPSGDKVVASKWHTTYITLAGSEGWEYDVPSLSDNRKIKPQSGRRLLGRVLPPGKTAEDYANILIGPEQFSWLTNDTLIYAKNSVDSTIISEDKDVHKGVYAIHSRNMTSGKDTILVDAEPGGASRPELSRDKRTIAFVRRVRDHEVLVLKDIQTGTIHHVFDGLSYDLSNVWAPMGTYPSFAFTPSDDAVIIWGAGQIHRVPLTMNTEGERVAGGPATALRFRAHIELKLADTLTGGIDLVDLETQDEMRVNAFRDLHVDAKGETAVFQAAGVTVVQDLRTGVSTKVPVMNSKAPYYSPSFVQESNTLVVHARWSDTAFTTFEISDLASGVAYEVTGMALGRYQAPAISASTGKIAFIKNDGDSLTGSIVATANPGLYVADILLSDDSATVSNIRFISTVLPGLTDRIQLTFVGAKHEQLLVQEAERVYTVDFEEDPSVFGQYGEHTVVAGRMTNEIAIASTEAEFVAMMEFRHIYVAPMKTVDGQKLWAKPGNATEGLVRLSVFGGHDIAWSGDGKTVFWFFGPAIQWLDVSQLKNCASEIEEDALHFGIACTQELVQTQEVYVSHSTDVARIKQESNGAALVVYNATILTMEDATYPVPILNGTMVVEGGLIKALGEGSTVEVPQGAKMIDAQGGFVIPGFIDVHAHWGGCMVVHPAKSWEMQAFLAYGITTLHNPSSDTITTFIERSRLESGHFVGPRSLTTGSPLFGGGWKGIHEEIVDMDEASAALMRLKAEGGPAAISYKNYQLPSRASRQRLLTKGRELGLNCVPEGGGHFDWDLTYIIDGMTTVEHSIPVSVLYDDVLTLFAKSGTGSTPTHVVSYGGPFGEEYVWAHEDIPNDPKLRNFIRHDILEGLHESKSRPENSYVLFNTSTSIAKMVHMGLKAHIGAHGERPMGYNYHAEMAFTKAGGLSNYEVLQAATSSAAQTLGLWGSVGSLTVGKLADFLVYHPEAELLEGPISDTLKLLYVARGGRVWDAFEMREVWPVEGRVQEMPPFNP